MSNPLPATSRPLTVSSLVAEMAQLLPHPGEGANAEAGELLALLSDQPRHWPIVARHELVSSELAEAAKRAARRRAAGAPMQYAAGRAAFRHLILDVDERVLIPRPETELLVDIVLDHMKDTPGGTVADVGTGSGAIALSLASEGRFARVIGTDISLDALTVARANAARLAPEARTRLDFRVGSLLEPVPERGLAAIVSNPPYISFEEADSLPDSVRNWEPVIALFADGNGMCTTIQLVHEAAVALAPRGVLALEVDMRRAAMVAQAVAAEGAFADVRIMRDLTGRERFVVARRLEEQG